MQRLKVSVDQITQLAGKAGEGNIYDDTDRSDDVSEYSDDGRRQWISDTETRLIASSR